MIILLSPTKTLSFHSIQTMISTPVFLKETNKLLEALRLYDVNALAKVLKTNEVLAQLNHQRYLNFSFDSPYAAITAYDGLVFKYLHSIPLDEKDLTFAQHHIRILSGMYGVLRPLDGISAYRLEMQSTLMMDNNALSLYQFWNDSLYRHLKKSSSVFINLASKEYSKAIYPYLEEMDTWITCTFLVNKQGINKMEATSSKMARGRMANFIIKQKLQTPNGLKAFESDGYRFVESLSTEHEYVFVK